MFLVSPFPSSVLSSYRHIFKFGCCGWNLIISVLNRFALSLKCLRKMSHLYKVNSFHFLVSLYISFTFVKLICRYKGLWFSCFFFLLTFFCPNVCGCKLLHYPNTDKDQRDSCFPWHECRSTNLGVLPSSALRNYNWQYLGDYRRSRRLKLDR